MEGGRIMNKMKKIIIPILIIAMFFCIMPKIEYAAETYKVGDINGDGVIDSRDTLRILEHMVKKAMLKMSINLEKQQQMQDILNH